MILWKFSYGRPPNHFSQAKSSGLEVRESRLNPYYCQPRETYRANLQHKIPDTLRDRLVAIPEN
jgi:hypothetical protein